MTVLSRTPIARSWRTERWDGATLGPWVALFEGADVVINLAGRNVNCRYTPENRQEILSSRVGSTRLVGEAIARARRPPSVWLNSSTATIYAHRYDAPNDEASGVLGGGEPDAPDSWRFSVDVARAWEQAVDDADVPETRRVKLRSALILGPDAGGIFDTLLQIVRLGFGGRAGSGRQYVSWIHERDFVAAVSWLLQAEDFDGVVNLAAPNPLPYAEFMAALRDGWGTRLGLPASAWMLEVGAFLLRTETELMLKSRRVVPRRLLESGYSFRYPEWREAARDLCEQWRRNRGVVKGARI